MIYEKRLTIPKNTAASAPVCATLEIHPGIVKRVDVYFPPGCAALAHVQLFYWERQIWPTNPNSDFTGDGTLLSFPEDLKIVDLPYEIEIRGWNPDDTYPHTPIVRIQMQAEKMTAVELLKVLALGPQGPQTPAEG